MDARTMNRLLAPISRRIRLMVARAVVTAIGDAGKIQAAQVKLLDGEVRDGIEVLHQYGFTSLPHGKPEGLYFSVGGDRDHGVLICVADRQFRLKSMAPGEVAIYDDLDQKIHLTRDGIVIDGAGLPLIVRDTPIVTIQAETKVRAETPMLECTGDIKDHCDSPDGKTMSLMRTTFNDHDHPENDAGGPTDPPNQQM